jgi:cytochrome o ubiquinol oxidase subunit 2
MTGHSNPLNIIANTPGDYPGSSAEINGSGFSGMKFNARVGSKEAFDFWVKEIKLNGYTLSDEEYAKILEPSEDSPVTFYSVPEENRDLYATVLSKYMGPGHDMHNMEKH